MTLILAHGLGGRVDLPIPVSLAQYGAAIVLVITFVLLARLWREPKYEGDGGTPVARIQRMVDAPIAGFLLRASGLAALTLTLLTAFLGVNDSSHNPAPTWVYVWFWVGLVPVSVVLGPVWRRMDPLPVISLGLRRLLRHSPHGLRPYPERLGRWPAAIGLLAFAWVELVMPERDVPHHVGTFVLIYTLVQLAGGVVYGAAWHERGGAFSAYSDYVARLGPWMRRSDGVLVRAHPLRNLAALPSSHGSLSVIVVLLGSTGFDGLTRSTVWTNWTRDISTVESIAAGTAGLMVAVSVIAFTFSTAVQTTARSLRAERHDVVGELPRQFAASLIPIAAGYTVAHYFSLLLFQGQAGYFLASDPFGSGWNLFDVTGRRIDYSVVTSTVIAWVQVVAIASGHFFGVLAAHDRAASLFREEEQRRAQTPLIVAMVCYTVTGIGLLLGS